MTTNDDTMGVPPAGVRPRVLVLAQTDSLDGESAGAAIATLYDAGAKNVQVIPTVTKKGRPGMLWLADTCEATMGAVESALVRELGVTGWHRLPTEHAYVGVRVESLVADVVAGDLHLESEVARKVSDADPDVVRPEHESCAALRRALAEHGVEVTLPLVRQRICEAFLSGEARPTIRF